MNRICKNSLDFGENKCKICLAFSLAEMLMAVLVVSIMLVAMAPVITKRVTQNVNINGVGYSESQETQAFRFRDDDYCSKVTTSDGSNEYADCNFTVPSNVSKIGMILVGAGGGGAGATAHKLEAKTAIASTTTDKTAASNSVTISKYMQDVKILLLAGGGGGGGGSAFASSSGGSVSSQADCDGFNAFFIPASYNGTSGKNLCVTKYNVGDTNGPTIASSVSKITAGSGTCSGTSCCWQGTTSSTCDTSGSYSGGSTTYSGCTRTVCTWAAANASCQAWAPTGTKAGDWRLPTQTEMAGWKSKIDSESSSTNYISKYRGSNGLQLCDYYSSSYGSPRCYYRSGGCSGSYNDNCNPYYVWSATPNGSDYYDYYLGSGTFRGPSSYRATYAFSARCVLEKGAQLFSSFAAGGGGGGAYAKNVTIPQSVISANVGGTIYLYAGAGGGGGAAASSSGSNGSNGSAGNDSYIQVKNTSGTVVWQLKVSGGVAGKQATGSSNGGATTVPSTACTALNSSAVSCATTYGGANGTQGSAGAKLVDQTVTSSMAASGGKGGNGNSISISGSASSVTTNVTLTGGGAGGTASSWAGSAGSAWGAGGGGGTFSAVSSGSSVTQNKGAGGAGKNGYAAISYNLVYSGSGGGGGGGGGFAHIADVDVTSGAVYKIKVGGGGAGGIAGSSAGKKGGDTSIVIGSTTYSVGGGAGGKLGTTATSATTNPTHGAGGSAGTSTITSAKLYSAGKAGSSGATLSNGNSSGGSGGLSGAEFKNDTPTYGNYGCGGLFLSGAYCTASGDEPWSGLTPKFQFPAGVFGDDVDYGFAGGGGGGGGWQKAADGVSNKTGGGAQGRDGYVYIYWLEYK